MRARRGVIASNNDQLLSDRIALAIAANTIDLVEGAQDIANGRGDAGTARTTKGVMEFATALPVRALQRAAPIAFAIGLAVDKELDEIDPHP